MSDEVRIGPYCTVADDVRFGNRVIIHGHANLYGCALDDDCTVGTFVEIQRDVTVGKRTRIQSHTFICSGVVIGDDVFIGHYVSFINDRHPTIPKTLAGTWRQEGIRVERGASIGTGAVLLCGIVIGEGAMIGAGSMVTKDVAPHTVVAGVPARVLRVLSEDERWNAPGAVQQKDSAL